MRAVGVCVGPVRGLMVELGVWLPAAGYSAASSAVTLRYVRRFSAWMAERGTELSDLSHAVIDDFLVAEGSRLEGRIPAAVQHLSVFRRFLVARGTLAPRPSASRDRRGLPRLLIGPLSGGLPDLLAWSKSTGYAKGTTKSVAETAARLSAWMQQAGLEVGDLSDELLTGFVAAELSSSVRHPSSARRIVAVRKFLLASGDLQIVEPEARPATVVDLELDSWGAWQRTERDVGARTVAERRGWAHDLVASLASGSDAVDYSLLDCATVNSYVADKGRGYSLSSRRHLVDAMVCLSRWAFLTRRLSRPLASGILRPRATRTSLPRALAPEQVAAIITAADPTTLNGARDRAVIVMIARLGLRAGEVASLTMDDLDWSAARVSVNGKGGRCLTLPLPVDVGSALVDYLQVRPSDAIGRAVFIRSRPPLTGLGRQGVSGIIAHRAALAGLGLVHAHRLRHSVATGVLAAGGTLTEARELLGHAHTDTTMIYAKTDLGALRSLTVPFGRIP